MTGRKEKMYQCRNKRAWAAGLLMLMAALGLTACGKKETGAESTMPEYVYVPEYEDLEYSGYMQNPFAWKDGLGFVSMNYDETEGKATSSLYLYNISTRETKSYPLELTPADPEGSMNVQNMCAFSDGSLALLASEYVVLDETTYETRESKYLLNVSAEDGGILSQTDITEALGESGRSYVQYFLVDSQDNLYLGTGDSGIVVLNKAGEKQCVIDTGSDNWIQDMGMTREGAIAYSVYDQTTGGLVINLIDPATRKVSKTCSNNVPNSWGNGSMTPGIEKGIMISGNTGLTEYDTETEENASVLNWVDCDINRDNMQFYMALEDGRIVVIMNDYTADKTTSQIVILTKTPSTEVAQKEIITLSAFYADSDVQKAVINFNKTNDQYRIRLNTYFGDGGTSEQYEDVIKRFNNDLTSGKGADIFSLDGLNADMLSQKGLLEDLNPYLDQDPELKREDFFQSVLTAYTIDDKLYSIPSSFSVQTVIGKVSDVGNEPGWTLDQLMALVESKPEGTEVFDYSTKSSILQNCLMFNFSNYVNWSTGECKLDSEDFVKILEFANQFPEEYDYDQEGPSTPSKIASGQLLLMATSFSSVQDYQMYSAMFNNEPINMIGYPAADKKGNAISGSSSFAINAKSKHKDAAWQFLRSMLTPEFYEKSNIWAFPTLISAYDKKCQEYMTPEYYTDENGEQVEQSKGSWGWDDFNVELYAATQEQVDQITALINKCERTYAYDEQIYSIIEEEAAPYFKGQKNAKEVADIIQSRVKLYVDENR